MKSLLKLSITASTLCLCLITPEVANASTILGPTPYLSFNDSPFNGGNFSYFHLDDFEDGLLNVPGVGASAGQVIGPSGSADSVDADDGVIDNSGSGGKSFWSGFPNATGVNFSFDAGALGSLPTHAGIVFTDSVNGTSITFRDSFNNIITEFASLNDTGDGNTQTAGDRFVGVVHSPGISSIQIVDSGRAFEVDHLQYGATTVPTPALLPGLIGMGVAALRKRKQDVHLKV